jgi:hypothetical protein
MPDENDLLKVYLRSIDTRLKPLIDELARVIQSLPNGPQRTELTKAYNVCIPGCFWFRIAFGETEPNPMRPDVERLSD